MNFGLDGLSIWTVYCRPRDYPSGYIARRFILDKPTGETVTGETLEAVRERLPWGLYRMERAPEDDPVIVEVWI